MIISYVGVVMINAGFEYRDYVHKRLQEKKGILEGDARKADAQYYHTCLSGMYPQQFFPSLIREPEWREIALKHDFMPLGAQPNENLSYCNEGYGFVTYTSDRYGFRNDDASWKSAVDVLLVGDSFMVGACVPHGKDIAGIINNTTELNAITLGSSSNDAQHYVALIEKFVPAIKAKYAVLAFYPNDNYEVPRDNFFIEHSNEGDLDGYTLEGVSVAAKSFFTEASSIIKLKGEGRGYSSECNLQDDYYLDYNNQASKNKENYQNIFSLSYINSWFNEVRAANSFGGIFSLKYTREHLLAGIGLRILGVLNDASSGVPNVTKMAITALFEKCTADCVPVILLLPNSEFWRPDSRAEGYLNGIRLYVEANYNNIEHILLDGRHYILSDDIDSFAPTGPHYSIEGYQKLADALLDSLVSYEVSKK